LTLSLARAFKNLAHKVVIFDEEEVYRESSTLAKNRYTNRLFWQYISRACNDSLIASISKEKPDLILILKGFYFKPKTIAKIKEIFPRISLFIFNPDNPFNSWHIGSSNNWIRESIPFYDVYFIWAKCLIERLKRAGAKEVKYLPFGYDAELHYPVEVSGEEKKVYGSDVAFIGTRDKEREWWLNYLLDYDLAIWGDGWEKANKRIQKKWRKKTVIGREFSKVCNASKIILNLIRKQNIHAHNMRTFEVPACKGFVLSTKAQEQSEFFEEGKDFACFSAPKELKEKIDYYLPRDELRREMALRAYEKGKCHTYLERVKRILDVYGKIKSSSS